MPSIVLSAYDRLLTELELELRDLHSHSLLRRPVTLEAADGARVRIDGRDVVCWCSNDYLGLSAHPAVVRAADEAARAWGVGARASRLLAGTSAWHARLEEALARWYAAESCVVFSSGYLANLGVLSALAGPDDVIVIDRLVHASLVDAARATRARLRVVAHNEPAAASAALLRHQAARRRFVVTEGVFSMEGDRALLAELLEAADAQEAILVVDDAHGAFVLGRTGRGTPQACGVDPARFILIGTLGKALGCQGGFVVGPKPLIELIRNRAKTFIYTTALATPVAAAAVAALQVVELEPAHRERLRSRVEMLHRRLAPFAQASDRSHIVPVVLGSAERALRVAQRLWEQGHWAPAIRPPTVPRGSARLRLSVTAAHTQDHIESLAGALQKILASSP